MRFVKQAAVAAVFILCLFAGPSAGAITVELPPTDVPKSDSSVLITAYAHQGSALYYVQIVNSSSSVIDMSGWRLRYMVTGQAEPIDVTVFNGFVKPGGYLVAADPAVVPSADIGYTITIPQGGIGGVSAIELIPTSKFAVHSVSVKTDAQHQHWRRNISASTGNYLATFTAFSPNASFSLYGNGSYDYPASTGLQITEVLPNPRSCSPVDTAGDCGDFVKLFNPTTASIDLSSFRLRVGYKGQGATPSNSFLLTGTLEAGQYVTISASADGRAVALPASGGYVWLEDAYGLMLYETTLIEYLDAASDTRKGHAWAYDTSDGTWKWSAQPTPGKGASVFPLPLVKPKVVAVNAPTPCKVGQYRSEETNRCRNIAAEATALAPCDEDEERNPETNRCRKLASTASQQLAPCKEGQVRNPDTNRCRNVTASAPPSAAFGVETAGETGKAFVGWWALGGLGVMALGYGIWEWRQEMIGVIQKVGSFFTSNK